eukprot:CAMPEP_0118725084 /NCGR_PEP_ID=MMETSP0800-20121206/32946_1 /TAXON_ID=210618 ORGANISM="Striatella unipunctata, Strain CCMP2910" /NCGR_SAMPLE_ID=MMETSP0800 /ASSEMBLY_ACC=CAM_ASM_000638 /LENGTH=355 /DNA_ID=CAMNT_0006633749 /DNA_START=6 /DNA_END=1073 /DNA_ORIENTATION=+
MEARFVHLATIERVVSTLGKKSFLKQFTASPKIQITTGSYGDLLLVVRPSPSDSAQDFGSLISAATATHMTTNIRDQFFAVLEKAIERRAWEESARRHEKARASQKIASRKVGVDAIITKQKLQHKEAARLADTVLDGDMDTLMREATDLVQVIHKYVKTLESAQRSNKKGDDDDDEDRLELSHMLEDMGMTSASLPISGSAREYHEALARHLADFLRPKLKQVGGMMTLTDAFCFFNRARGTNMISPEDMLAALKMWPELPRLGLSQRDFASGVRVVQDDTILMQPKEILDKLTALSSQFESNGITTLDASKILSLSSAMLTHEQLMAAEQMGFLCRDVTLAGTRFFPNKFRNF